MCEHRKTQSNQLQCHKPANPAEFTDWHQQFFYVPKCCSLKKRKQNNSGFGFFPLPLFFLSSFYQLQHFFFYPPRPLIPKSADVFPRTTLWIGPDKHFDGWAQRSI